jgi:RNA polymerase sigma-70 factor (ECF subfamily)
MLMVAAQGGDRVAYAALLKSCVPLITVVARKAGASMDCVDDVVQETLITLHRARHTYDPARPFVAWLSVLAQRRAIDVLRRQGRNRTREVHAPIDYENYATTEQTAEQRLEDEARRRVLHDAVANLPAAQQEAVRHLAIDEQSLNEASAVTSRSKGALKVNFHRALAALRTRLSGERQ